MNHTGVDTFSFIITMYVILSHLRTKELSGISYV